MIMNIILIGTSLMRGASFLLACLLAFAWARDDPLLVVGDSLVIESTVPNSLVLLRFADLCGCKTARLTVLNGVVEGPFSDVKNGVQTISFSSSAGGSPNTASFSPVNRSGSSQLLPSSAIVVFVTLLFSRGSLRVALPLTFLLLLTFAYSEVTPNQVTIVITLDISLQSIGISLIAPSVIVNTDEASSDGVRCGVSRSALGRCPSQLCEIGDDPNRCFSALTENLQVVGVLMPKSGDFGKSGAQIFNGIRLAVNQIELPLYFVSADTGTDANIAVKAAEILFQKGARLFIGPAVSEAAIELDDWAKGKDVAFISPTVSARAISDLPSVLTLNILDDSYTQALLSLFADRTERVQCVIIHRDGTVGNDLSDIITKDAGWARVFNFVARLPYAPNGKADYPALVAQLNEIVIENNVETVVAFSLDEIADILEIALEYPALTAVRWTGIGFALSCEVAERAKPLEMARKVGLRSSFFEGASSAQRNILAEEVFSKVEQEKDCATPYALLGYDAVLMLTESSRISRTLVTSSIVEGVKFSSNFTYGASGWLGLDYRTGERTSGQFSIVSIGEEDLLKEKWMKQALVFLTPTKDSSGPLGRFQQSITQLSALPIDRADLEKCDNPDDIDISISYRDANLVRKNPTINSGDFRGRQVLVPLLDEIDVRFKCNSFQFQLVCPPFHFGGIGSCVAESDSQLRSGNIRFILPCRGQNSLFNLPNTNRTAAISKRESRIQNFDTNCIRRALSGPR